jgi:fumarate reductase subunit C
MANLHWDATWIGMAWPALHLWIWRTRQHVSPFMLRASTAASVISLLIIGIADYIHVRALPTGDTIFLDFSSAGIALVVSPLLALAFLAWLWRAHWRTHVTSVRSVMAYGLPASAVALALTGILLWDRRPPMTRYLESHLHSPHPFEAFVPANAVVYWDNGLDAAWFMLKRQSYFSPAQGAGLLFNEATAHAWDKRNAAFRALGNRRASCELFTMLLGKVPEGTPPCHSMQEYEAQAICRQAPTLQFLVSAKPYSRMPLAVWEVPEDQGPMKTQYLYACDSFR